MRAYLDMCSVQRPLDTKSHVRISVSPLELIKEVATTGYGNYTEERDVLFKDLSLDQALDAMRSKNDR